VTRYHLNIRNGSGYVPDDEGHEYANLGAAREQALVGIRSLISEEAKTGVLDLTGSIEISDRDGNLLSLVSFEDAMDLRLTGSAP
jgi:hypothetical protein